MPRSFIGSLQNQSDRITKDIFGEPVVSRRDYLTLTFHPLHTPWHQPEMILYDAGFINRFEKRQGKKRDRREKGTEG
jgi:hypothetical protein